MRDRRPIGELMLWKRLFVGCGVLAIASCAAAGVGGVGTPVQSSPVGRAAASPVHICWIADIGLEGAGVRVRFAPDAPIASERRELHLEVGARASPSTSGHDGCVVTASRRDGVLGVLAEAHLFDAGTMTEPQVRSEFIPAAMPRR